MAQALIPRTAIRIRGPSFPSSAFSPFIRSFHSSHHHHNSYILSSTTKRPTKPTPTVLSSSSVSSTFYRSYSSSNNNDPASTMSEPTGLIANEGLEFLTFGTPNGYKITALLEELKAHYGSGSSSGGKKFPKITYQTVNIMKNTQKEPWFTALNPNGRIPVLVDHDRGGFAVFEGLAILTYLTRHYDPDHVFSFPVDSDDYSIAEQWISWQHGGLGPMQGQANHFLRFAKEKIPYGIQRYVGESERLYGILDARLKDRDYVAGPGRGKYSIADISILGWANIALLSGIDIDSLFPNIVAWLDRCLSRPATKQGFSIPNVSSLSNEALRNKIKTDPEEKRKDDEIKKLLADAKAQYNYKYSSP